MQARTQLFERISLVFATCQKVVAWLTLHQRAVLVAALVVVACVALAPTGGQVSPFVHDPWG